MADLRVLVVGCGNMGASHAEAYHAMEGVTICGLVARGESRELLNQRLGAVIPLLVTLSWRWRKPGLMPCA